MTQLFWWLRINIICKQLVEMFIMRPSWLIKSNCKVLCQEPTYNPQVEAISPTLPPDETSQSSKDQLLQAISKVDREISKVDRDIQKLKKKQVDGSCSFFYFLFSSFLQNLFFLFFISFAKNGIFFISIDGFFKFTTFFLHQTVWW